MLTYKRFIIDYKKTLFEVCYDFLRFTIERSKRLDILLRPWAPDPVEEELKEIGQLPSWVRRLSEHSIFSNSYGGPMERINADSLVGRPGTGREAILYGRPRNPSQIYHTLGSGVDGKPDPPSLDDAGYPRSQA